MVRRLPGERRWGEEVARTLQINVTRQQKLRTSPYSSYKEKKKKTGGGRRKERIYCPHQEGRTGVVFPLAKRR